jgi:hypothetical protein
METGLLEKTGKSLDEWIEIVNQSKIEKHREIMNFLQNDYSLSYGFSNLIALKARKSDAGSIEEAVLMENQYKGKEQLIPIYDELMNAIAQFGDDITVTPKKDSVSLIRKRQFALIKPASKTRIDLGLKFKNKPFEGRLENSGPFGAMCTHRVQLSAVSDVDAEVIAWLQEAYDVSV